MQPFLDLAKLWPYLPHFRIVAEYESLSKASRRFGLSNAALSKAIRTLERSLQLELFDRAGGKLRINDHGRALLGAIRGAMRDIDDAIGALRGVPAPTALRVALDSAWACIVLACASGDDVELIDLPAAIARALLRADADIVIHTEPVAHHELDTTAIATFERAVCVATQDPLAATLSSAALADKPFIAHHADGWPAQFPRRVAFATGSLAHALSAAASGACATVAPRELAGRFGLRAITVSDAQLPPLTLWASVRRSRRGAPTAPLRWRDKVREHCEALASRAG
jgi:DNA-binding transcriptional LysR family regulator